MKYVLGFLALALTTGVAYSEIVRDGYCTPGEIVEINLTHVKLTDPYRLNIPCEYFPNAYKDDGDHKSVQINFFKDTLEPSWPWHLENPDAHNWQDNEIQLRISRSSNPDMVTDYRKAKTKYQQPVDKSVVIEEEKNFDLYVSIHGKYPQDSYDLYPYGQSESKTFLNCPIGGLKHNQCKVYVGHTIHNGLHVQYQFHHEHLANWEEIEKKSLKLIDQFTEEN